jgi:mono/diheme cytochrome c family protein
VRLISFLAAITIGLAGAAFLLGPSGLPATTAQPGLDKVDPAVVQQGAILFAAGNCASCHTAPGGKELAGGVALPTKFGTVYSTNITPDPETGIGGWPEAAFSRAMREGVSRDGHQLYPAFPYDHYTLLSDADIHALYSYVMGMQPVRQAAHPNDLKFPFNYRPAIRLWKAIYFRGRRFEMNPAKDSLWNRGAYLAEGIAHCGACHTPRNFLGAEARSQSYSGASIEGWYAYAIDGTSPAPVRWTQEAIAFYLSHGWQKDHGMARGPMAPVVMGLSTVPDADIRAIATYFASFQNNSSKPDNSAPAGPAGKAANPASADSLAVATGQIPNNEGGAIYKTSCAPCHESGRPLPFGGMDLHLSTAITGPVPANIINVTLYGLPQQPGLPSAVMPGFRGALTEHQISALLAYLREHFGSKPQWPNLEEQIAKAMTSPPRIWPAPAASAAIANSRAVVRPW